MYSSLTEGEKFCLRWNECEANLSSSVRDLRDNNELFDLTLACDDDHHIQVHRLVLSASSSFFRNLLRRLPQHNPLVYLKGIRQTDLQAVLSFVYNGEVNIAQQDLSTFLLVAEDLKIKGLTQCQPPSSCPQLRPTQPRRSLNSRLPSETRPLSPQVPVKTEPDISNQSGEPSDISRPEESLRNSVDQLREENELFITEEGKDFHVGVPLTVGVSEGNKVEVLIKEESIESLNPDDELEVLGELYKCRLCYKSLDCLDTAKNHILAHFALPGGLTCLQCGLSFNSKVLFGVHMSSEHRNIKKW